MVSGIKPNSGPTTGGTSVTITGSNLSGATGVSFGGAGGSIKSDSSTQITATSPAGSGTVDVTVTTKGGTSATSGSDRFTYITPAPTVSLVSPKSGPAGGGTSVTITGQNLSGATSVTFGGTAGSITADNSTVITVTSPAGSGTVDIKVTTPGGTVTAGQFTYIVPAPTVTRYTPNTSNGCGSTTVDIFGTNLSGATVSFGGTDRDGHLGQRQRDRRDRPGSPGQLGHGDHHGDHPGRHRDRRPVHLGGLHRVAPPASPLSQ